MKDEIGIRHGAALAVAGAASRVAARGSDPATIAAVAAALTDEERAAVVAAEWTASVHPLSGRDPILDSGRGITRVVDAVGGR